MAAPTPLVLSTPTRPSNAADVCLVFARIRVNQCLNFLPIQRTITIKIIMKIINSIETLEGINDLGSGSIEISSTLFSSDMTESIDILSIADNSFGKVFVWSNYMSLSHKCVNNWIYFVNKTFCDLYLCHFCNISQNC